MPNEPKDLQKNEEKESVKKKIAIDTASRTTATILFEWGKKLMPFAVWLITTIWGYLSGLSSFYYWFFGIVAFFLTSLGFYLLSFRPTNKQIEEKEKEKSAIEILEAEHKTKIDNLNKEHLNSIRNLETDYKTKLQESENKLAKYIELSNLEVEVLQEKERILKKELEDISWLIEFAKNQKQNIADFVSVEGKVIKAEHEFEGIHFTLKIVFALRIFNKSVFKITFENENDNGVGGKISFNGETFTEKKRFFEEPKIIEPLCTESIYIEQRLDRPDVNKLQSALQAYKEEFERYRDSSLVNTLNEPLIDLDELILTIKIIDDDSIKIDSDDSKKVSPPRLRTFGLKFELKQIKT
jgi:hypothetical protein